MSPSNTVNPTRRSDHGNWSQSNPRLCEMYDSSIWVCLVPLAHVFEILLLESYADINNKNVVSVDPYDGEQTRGATFAKSDSKISELPGGGSEGPNVAKTN